MHCRNCPEVHWSCCSDLEQLLLPCDIGWVRISKSCDRGPIAELINVGSIFHCRYHCCKAEAGLSPMRGDGIIKRSQGGRNKHPGNWDVSSIFSHFSPFLGANVSPFLQSSHWGPDTRSHPSKGNGPKKGGQFWSFLNPYQTPFSAPVSVVFKTISLPPRLLVIFRYFQATPNSFSWRPLFTQAPQSGRNKHWDIFPSLLHFLLLPQNWETGTAIDGENFAKDRLWEDGISKTTSPYSLQSEWLLISQKQVRKPQRWTSSKLWQSLHCR